MKTRSLRLSPGTPPDMVIAAFNGLAERMDAIEASTVDDGDAHIPEVMAIPFRDVKTFSPARNGSNGWLWTIKLDRSVKKGFIVRDLVGRMAWVLEVEHDEGEEFSSLRVRHLFN